MSQTHLTIPSESPVVSRQYSIPFERNVEFDLTTFPDSETFTDLCNRHELTETHTVDDITHENIQARYWHWYNDKVLMITCVNPVTGERTHPSGEVVFEDPGYASYIMLKGVSNAVINLYEDIVANAAHIKGGEVHEARIAADGARHDCEDRYPEKLQQFWDAEFGTPHPEYR